GRNWVGKSTFVKLVTGNTNISIGHSMESGKKEIAIVCHHYEVTIGDKEYVLVDTPGFNDTYFSDSEVLQSLVEWLKSTYQAGTKLSGILYLHRITDSRMQGSMLRNLNMFKQLCGEGFYKHITLGITCWALVPNDVAEKRESELVRNSNFWKSMLDRGARVEKIPDDVEAARNLVVRISNHEAVVPKVVEEMGRGMNFADLSATKILNYELEQQRRQQELERQRLLEEQETHQRQRDAQVKMQAKAHELQLRRQFHIDAVTRCVWTKPNGSCNRCGHTLPGRGPAYRTYFPQCVYVLLT
ncbi:hypothetical protein BGZ60DRAFT_368522, partial [Tricladium varicosporioides]